jgi:signal peptidase I
MKILFDKARSIAVAARIIKFTRAHLIVIVLALFSLIVYLQPYRLEIISGKSMTPALQDGELIMVDCHYYRRMPLQKGDIVSCVVGGKKIIKRVYALPGEQVIQLHNEKDKSNDMIISSGMVEKALRFFPGSNIKNVNIEPGFMFLFGDAGMFSSDSRDFGPVSQNTIVGRVLPLPHVKIIFFP